MNKDAILATISVPTSFTNQRVSDLLCSAIEGGSDYWIDSLKRVGVPSFQKGGPQFLSEVPFVEGGALAVTCENPNAEGDMTVQITPSVMAAGLQLLADKYPKHFRDFVDENDDADTADVWLQLCMFGEVVFS